LNGPINPTSRQKDFDLREVETVPIRSASILCRLIGARAVSISLGVVALRVTMVTPRIRAFEYAANIRASEANQVVKVWSVTHQTAGIHECTTIVKGGHGMAGRDESGCGGWVPEHCVIVADPVASGIVALLDRPSGNVTGFAQYEATLGGKWLELLSEIATGLKRAAIMFNPDTAPASAFLPSLETAARSLKVALITVPVHSDVKIETAITALGREPGRSTPVTVAVQRDTRTIPIVFANVGDPVATGLVARLDRPSGNVTGFANIEASMGGKLLELLSEITPGLKRAAIMFNPDTAPVSALMPSFETAARSLKVVPIITSVRSDAEIETAIIALGRESGSGLVVLSDAFMLTHRAPVILAAAQNDVPVVYTFPNYARDGGLLSFGSDQVDTIRRAATYVDRILRGAKPGDLPVQFPVKYEMVVNLKTAKALGLTVPQSILLSADEVIQ
jgi:putative ABC transport system substrate-binding protein